MAHRVHGAGRFGRFNRRLATAVTGAVGTMPCAYLFAALALISLPAALATRDPLTIVGWVAQTFLQLVLLSVIIVGQRIDAEHADARAEQDHAMLTAILRQVGAAERPEDARATPEP